MSAEGKKYQEFLARVGNSEPHYCGQCKTKTNHLMVQTTASGPGALSGTRPYYTFSLRCRECGYSDPLFTTPYTS